MELRTTVSRDNEDITLQVTGLVKSVGEARFASIYAPADFKGPHITARVDGILYSVEKNILVRLWWSGSSPAEYVVSLEGRGMLDPGKLGGLVNPKIDGFDGGIVVEAISLDGNEGRFSLLLDLYKQRT